MDQVMNFEKLYDITLLKKNGDTESWRLEHVV